ncbi:MAG: cupin domain-containing protein [Ferruginibacter sp.]|nr:cupin domain-containing protein [Bacteroidota bacterium]MBX2918493.1 cupin domain-containing protein [Ferruginibacter sp.]
MQKVNLAEKFSFINDYFNPRIIGELNGQHVKAVKLKGEFVWHSHAHEDEMFMIVKGKFDMELRDKTVTISEGEFFIVPKGIEHKPVAVEEVHLLLFEPASTLNTGDVQNELTKTKLEKL